MHRAFILFSVLAVTGCATNSTAVRDLASQELACPRDSIKLVHTDRHFYRATGCGASVEVACYDPHESTGAAKGWTDPLTAGNRARCETLRDRSALVLTSSSTAPASAAPAASAAFDKGLAAKLLGASTDRARTSCVRRGGPSGPGHARITFGNNGAITAVVVEPPFAGTEVGVCVGGELSRVSLPPFSGEAITLGKHFEIPSTQPAAPGSTDL